MPRFAFAVAAAGLVAGLAFPASAAAQSRTLQRSFIQGGTAQTRLVSRDVNKGGFFRSFEWTGKGQYDLRAHLTVGELRLDR